MILEFGFKNFRMFRNENIVSFKADRRTKYLRSNITDIENLGVLKAIALYGPNNAGKSNIIGLLRIFKEVLQGNVISTINRDIFNDSPITEAYIIFNTNGNEKYWIRYDFAYDSKNKVFIKEKLSKINFYVGGSSFTSTIFEKDVQSRRLEIFDVDNSHLLGILPNDKPFLHTISYEGDFNVLLEWKEALQDCSENIVILKMFNIPIEKTINMLKSKDEEKVKFINAFVKSADLSIDNFEYNENVDIQYHSKNVDEKALYTLKNNEDTLRLTTRYGSSNVPSFFFDSSGTKKVEAIASYVYECIKLGKLLVVDELDNGLHFSLTRAIVSAFNNMINKYGQIIFSAHDLLLIDCNYLLRKDQIYFIHRNKSASHIICLKKFTSKNAGYREGENLIKRYNHGDFGPVPIPTFIDELFEVVK